MTATTPGTASNSESRKRLAEQAAATCPTVIHVGEHSKHWDPAVVQLIEQARAEGAAVESLALDSANERAERWKARCDEARATIARVEALAADWERHDLGTDRLCAADLRLALRGPR